MTHARPPHPMALSFCLLLASGARAGSLDTPAAPDGLGSAIPNIGDL